jgi:hypothetical protein
VLDRPLALSISKPALAALNTPDPFAPGLAEHSSMAASKH